MKKLRLALAVAVVAFFTVIAPSPAQSYPAITVNVSEATVVGGNQITIEAVVVPSVECEEWTLTFMGDTRNGSGPSITETFDTPAVDDVEKHDAVATCVWDDPHPGPGPDDNDAAPAFSGGGSTGTLGAGLGTVSLANVLVSATGTGTQTLLPLGDDDDDDGNGGDDGDGGGILPNTGGERLAWLVIGGMLVLVGAGVVVASRRRDNVA